jgi:CRP/FNR family cyclic AMP-dependent transcriptional regulator
MSQASPFSCDGAALFGPDKHLMPGDPTNSIPASVSSRITSAGTRIYPHQGSVLIRQNESATSVLLIEHGLVRVWVTTGDGRQLVLALRGRGELIGEMAAIAGRPRSASVTALTDITAVVVPSHVFMTILRDEPQFSVEMMRRLVHRVDESDRKRLETGMYAVPRRLARLLLELADNHGRPADRGGLEIRHILSQEELGNAIGATRESVVRALRALRDKKILNTSRRRIFVLERDLLAEEAGVPT